MSYYVYILISRNLNKFYIGETHDIEARILQHNTSFYKNSFTSKATDWELYTKIECKNRKTARAIEKHLKKMKSKRYLQNLKRYPEIGSKLLKRYSN